LLAFQSRIARFSFTHLNKVVQLNRCYRTLLRIGVVYTLGLGSYDWSLKLTLLFIRQAILVKTSYRVIITFIVFSIGGVVYAQAPSAGSSQAPTAGSSQQPSAGSSQEPSAGSSQEPSARKAQEPSANWNYQCNKSKRCFVYSDGATRLVFSKKSGKSNKSMRASVILPLGVAVGSPVTLHVGGERNLMLEVNLCNEKLCEAQIQAQYAMKLAEQLVSESSLDVASTIAGAISIESIEMSGYVGQMYKM
jgi:invasion protein IalB